MVWILLTHFVSQKSSLFLFYLVYFSTHHIIIYVDEYQACKNQEENLKKKWDKKKA